MRSPILFLIFNRPDTTQRVFEEIRKARPPRLYVAADGPRKDRLGEAELCERTRKIVNWIDWDCELKTLFRDENLGCGIAVADAITWFFENEEEGIILEDDIVAHPDFFVYCDELLKKYRADERVWTIGGHNLFYNGINRDCSYGFLSIAHIWGWATWKRAWNNFRFDLSDIEYKDFKNALKFAFPDIRERFLWRKIFKEVRTGKADIWDYQWTILSILNRKLCIVPYSNLTKNIGFGVDSTHTYDPNSKEVNHSTCSILPLRHPQVVEVNYKDEEILKRESGLYISVFGLVKGYISKVKKIIGSIIRK